MPAPRRRGRNPGARLSARPTARGWQALVFGGLLLFVARLIGTTQFYQLAYALLGLVVVSLALGVLGSRGLGFARSLPAGVRFTAGNPSRVDLLVSNGSRFGTSEVVVIDRLSGRRRFEVAPLRGRGGEVVEAPVTFGRRGIYDLGPAEVRVLDPFRLLQFTRKFPGRTEVVVYPEVHDLAGFSLGSGNTEAGASGSFGQRGEEFAGLREYRRGDDRRHIHWKSLARTGEVFVKEFALQAPRRYTVALDLSRQGLRAPERQVEDAVSAAASVLAHLKEEGLPFRLLCTDPEGTATEFASADKDYWSAMRLLATVRPGGGRDLGSVVLDEQGKLGEGVILISRTNDEALPRVVSKLRAGGRSVVVVVLAPHTYFSGAGGEQARRREAAFLRHVGRLERAGAVVHAVRHPSGVAGLGGGRRRLTG